MPANSRWDFNSGFKGLILIYPHIECCFAIIGEEKLLLISLPLEAFTRYDLTEIHPPHSRMVVCPLPITSYIELQELTDVLTTYITGEIDLVIL